jgi:hypothetical protein
MKKKILCIVFCTLLFTTFFPISGLSQNSGEINAFRVIFDPPGKTIDGVENLATPGYMSFPPFPSVVTKNPPYHPTVTVSSANDIVIQMLEEIDESLVLRFLENLTSFGPRYTGTSSCEAAAEYIYDEYQSMGLDVQYHHWSMGGYTSDNVVATLNGTNEDSDEIYIVCGHYDTVASSPGADDDGSGTIAAMVAAYVMSQYPFEHTIKFIAFSGEEEGLYGSRAYASEAYSNGDNIVGVLNADMIGFALSPSDENQTKIYENTASEWLFAFTYDVNDEYDQYIQLSLLHSGSTWGSDHNSFWDFGFDALFYQEYNFNDYYHSPQDTIEHMNIPYTTKNVKLITATLAELGQPPLSSSPEIPTITGPTIGAVNHEYSYTVTTTDPDGDDVYHLVNWGDETETGWIGPYNSGEQVTLTHLWDIPGEYEVRVRAKDINNVPSKWSDPLFVTMVIDQPPNTPTINGKDKGMPGREYLYKFLTTDPDGNDVYYHIDWGDGNIEEWLGPYDSGEIVPITHTWEEKGIYTIKVKAKDVYDLESGLGTFTVNLPRTKTVDRPFIQLLKNFLENFQNSFPIIQKLLTVLRQ